MEIKGPAAVLQSLGIVPIQASAAGKTATQTVSTQLPADTTTLKIISQLLQPGQLLDVVVQRADKAGQVQLSVQTPLLLNNGQPVQLQLRAQTPLTLQAGQQLTAQVQDLNQHLPVLQLHPRSEQHSHIIRELLAQLVQQQKPLTSLLTDIQALHTRSPTDTTPLPASVQKHIDTLWRQFVSESQLLQPGMIKQAMRDSGPFLEATLAKLTRGEKVYPAMDIRAALLKLATQIQQQPVAVTPAVNRPHLAQTTATAAPQDTSLNATRPASAPLQAFKTSSTPATDNPPAMPIKPGQPQVPARIASVPGSMANNPGGQILEQLLTQIESGLARIQLQQVHMLNSDPQRPLWLMEIPIRHGEQLDLFELHIQRDAQQQQGKQHAAHPWSLSLAFNLQGLGAMRVQINLQQQHISTLWWAERESTVALFEQYRQNFEARLKVAGLNIETVRCQCDKDINEDKNNG